MNHQTVSAVTGRPIATPQMRARTNDPETSKAAARSVNFGEGHALVLRALRVLVNATDEQIFDAITKRGFQISPSGCRSRRLELCEQFGLVVERGVGRTEAGRKCKKWSLTEKGLDRATQIAVQSRQGRLCA